MILILHAYVILILHAYVILMLHEYVILMLHAYVILILHAYNSHMFCHRTTRDYEGPSVAPHIKAALDAALDDEEDLIIDANKIRKKRKFKKMTKNELFFVHCPFCTNISMDKHGKTWTKIYKIHFGSLGPREGYK